MMARRMDRYRLRQYITQMVIDEWESTEHTTARCRPELISLAAEIVLNTIDRLAIEHKIWTYE